MAKWASTMTASVSAGDVVVSCLSSSSAGLPWVPPHSIAITTSTLVREFGAGLLGASD